MKVTAYRQHGRLFGRTICPSCANYLNAMNVTRIEVEQGTSCDRCKKEISNKRSQNEGQ